MLGRRGNPFLAAHHMGDAHQMVVDDIGEVIGRQPVRFHQHLHVDHRPFEFDRAAQRILNHAYTLIGYQHAHNMAHPPGIALGAFGLGQFRAAAVIFGWLLCRHLLRAHARQFLGRAIAFEGVAIVEQAVAMLGIDRAAFGLAIGAVRAADIGALIPAEPQPTQRIEDFLFGFARRSHLIGILDAQQELPAMLFGKAIVDQRDIGGADMRVAGG